MLFLKNFARSMCMLFSPEAQLTSLVWSHIKWQVRTYVIAILHIWYTTIGVKFFALTRRPLCFEYETSKRSRHARNWGQEFHFFLVIVWAHYTYFKSQLCCWIDKSSSSTHKRKWQKNVTYLKAVDGRTTQYARWVKNPKKYQKLLIFFCHFKKYAMG